MGEQQRAPIGLGRVMHESPLGGSNTAELIRGFWLDEYGFLRNDFRIMPLIPEVWNATQNVSNQPLAFADVRGMAYHRMGHGEVPTLLFFCASGVFRLAMWTRAGGGGNAGLEELKYWRFQDASGRSVKPQSVGYFRPQAEGVGDQFFFTFCDGGRLWVYDGQRLRPFGYPNAPPPPSAQGPTRLDGEGSTQPNGGGFSHRGRIGSTESDWTTPSSADPANEVVGGIDNGEWDYWMVWENEPGGYSPISPAGGNVSIRQALASIDDGPEALLRAFWVKDIAVGPPGTRARILLRSKNLKRARFIDDTRPRFLHRIPNNVTTEYIDNIPDGELGRVWEDREPAPSPFLIRFFGGSLFLMGSEGYPNRIWWTEQGGTFGAVLESIKEGHWMDLAPETGRLTGSILARPPANSGAGQSMLILTERACHYVAGQYPSWAFGTLHAHAGLDGPDLIMAIPDGSVVWYGAGTFWRYSAQDGSVVDIGGPIQRRLKRVHRALARFGQSWLDEHAGEAVFVLPQDDEDLPQLQCVWDYNNQGWRIREDVKVKSALMIPETDYVLLAGFWGASQTVWAYHYGYPGYAFTPPVAVYRTAWINPTLSEDVHAQSNPRSLTFMMRETYQGTANIIGYQDWNQDTKVFGLATDGTTEDETVNLHHPENDITSFFAPSPASVPESTGTAEYAVSPWRTARVYSQYVPVELEGGTAEVVQFELHSSNHMAFFMLDAYAAYIGGPGARTPRSG